MKKIDLVGHKYNRLTVVSLVCRTTHGAHWLCRCDCGTEKKVSGSSLRNGNTKSCGCFRKELASKKAKQKVGIKNPNYRHGLKNTSEYPIWKSMRMRCRNPNDKAYRHYGGRGIEVCERWSDFKNFIADMGERPSTKHSIDRINNNGNYEPSNCRWATRTEQANNTNSNVRILHKGLYLTVGEWARKIGVHRSKLFNRLYRGETSEQILKEYKGE